MGRSAGPDRKEIDLENTNIYVHGDGARLIKEAQEWLPKSRFVLDRITRTNI